MAEAGVERRLAAIVAIDVAGYSRLMGADEEGTLATLKAHRSVIDPISQNNGGRGISVNTDSRATLTDNDIRNNGNDGILIGRGSIVTITNNVSQNNGRFGILVFNLATAEIVDNTITQNDNAGIRISSTGHADIGGNAITQNMSDGIRVGGGSSRPGMSTATIGLDIDTTLKITGNGGAGVLVIDDGFGSEATIDSRNIEFADNAEGDTVGNVIDAAP